MAESEAKDWVEDLHRREGSMRFGEKEHKRIVLRASSLILSCNLWRYVLHADCHSGTRIDKSRCFSVTQIVVHLCWLRREARWWNKKQVNLLRKSTV